MTASKSLYRSSAGEKAIMDFYNKVLANWQVDYDTVTVETRYGETFVIASGDPANPAILLLHGGTSNATSWAGDVAVYAEHFRVYAVDQIGDPGRSAPTRPSFESDAFAEWLDDVRIGLKLEKMMLVGLSQGGWIALKYAITYPVHVSALVLLTPGGIAPHNALFMFQMMTLFLLGKWGQTRAMKMLFADFPIPEGTVEIMGLIMRHFKANRVTLPLFSDEELATLKMPVLLVGGEKDRLLDVPATAERLSAQVPQLQIHIIDGAGHAIVHTASEVVNFLLKLPQQEQTIIR